MGDGGVACLPLQRDSIMDRLSAPENAVCSGGGSNGSNGNDNGFSSMPLKLAESEPKKKKKKIRKVIKRVVTVRKVETVKSKVAAAKKDSSSKKDIQNGEVCIDKSSQQQNDDVEEGELGTLMWPTKEVESGEIMSDKPQRIETVKEGFFIDRQKKGDQEKEKDDSASSKSREWEKGEITPEKGCRGDIEKGEIGSLRNNSDEIENGEFIPDRWHESELSRDDFSYSKSRMGKDRSWRHDLERTPPMRKYSDNGISSRKDLSRSTGSQHSKDFYRREGGLERNARLSSKIVDEDGSYRGEQHNGKNPRREYLSGNRLKRHNDHDAETDGSDRDHDRKHHTDYSGSKSRRISDDGSRYVYSDHHFHRSPERLSRNSSTSRHPESSSSFQGFYDICIRSPVYPEWGPRNRPRQNDHRDGSPIHRERSPFVRDTSPVHPRRTSYSREKSPYGRNRSPHGRERTHGRDRSPNDRNHHFDRRHRTPVLAERSLQDRGRCHDRRDQNQLSKERSAQDRVKSLDSQDASQKSGASGKPSSRAKTKVVEEEKQNQKASSEKNALLCRTDSQCKTSMEDVKALSPCEKGGKTELHKDDLIETPASSSKDAPHVDVALPEELQSMEEDMDISDTPPHVPVVVDSTTGKWVYYDYYGAECGPSRLCELKFLVEEGALCSDHFIKHLDGDRWVTVENASSPLVTLSFPSIVPEIVTQLVSPPEAPGNLIADAKVAGRPVDDVPTADPDIDFCLDERIAALLEGYTLDPGNELETIGEALQMTFDPGQWVKWGNLEDPFWNQACIGEQCNLKKDDTASSEVIQFPEPKEMSAPDQDFPWALCESGNWFPGQCSCKGGDWKRIEETAEDRFWRRKVVLNDGFPLCEMPKSGIEDPRWLHKDALYYPSYSSRLDLPTWAFSLPEENDSEGAGKSLVKPAALRGVRGTMLSVVRINACVVYDKDSLVPESRSRPHGKDRYSSRAGRTESNSELRRCSVERDSRSRSVDEDHSRSSRKTAITINIPKDRVCTVHDLQLHLGDWYYLDGTGREQGPSSFSELQSLVHRGIIQKNSTVFRKFDKVWVPVPSSNDISEPNKSHRTSNMSFSSSGPSSQLHGSSLEQNLETASFHSMHPQFIGYMRGKLHELVMRSYKSREFSASINEVLDPWINAKQPKKDTEKQIYRKSDAYLHASKRARHSVEESDEESELEGVMQTIQRNEPSFEELCHDATFSWDENTPDIVTGSWGLLDGHVLARVFHFLRSDIRSLVVASSTCQHWRAAARFYRNVARLVDLSTLGPICTDTVFRNNMDGFNRANISSMVITGCSNISSDTLEEILCSCPFLSYIDISGCSQFAELTLRYPNLNWAGSQQKFRDVNSRVKGFKQLTERSSSNFASTGGELDDVSELKDYFASADKRDSSGQSFRRGFYKRSKVFGARKALSIISGDARVSRWDAKKSEKGYKRMEEFLVASLKEIMKENTFGFFVPKVADIEDRIKSGYYILRGIGSIKEDISRMCRDAIKAKNRGDGGDVNRIVKFFIQLASRLESSSKSSFQKDDIIKSWKDDSSAGSSASIKYKKKTHKFENERRHSYRSNGSSSLNGHLDGEYASDREIRKRLAKLNRRSADSESETSDEFDLSSEITRSESECTASETESDLVSKVESRTDHSRAIGFLDNDGGLESLDDDREWGARMTKASVVPPVTRKYEVIDKYIIVEDEENVKSKMQVALPEDYSEKLDALKNGTEELDMELPEVKEYKPRKRPGIEVIEQEVYGIDPYTHNLLLDSMPEELDWSLSEKHCFIEDVLLCTLNNQVRDFTGTGNTPMMYDLQPVIEEVERIADEDHDIRTVKMCQGILRAIDSRPDDKYVAYRKGLGVVCNKEGGFGEDDFIVEFLGEVYPTWRWFEKQDGIRSLQRNSKDPAPEFYNIYLERPKGDADGYDLVVVDAMHKANYASRICHSCKPNCEAKVTAVDGQYQIGIYSVRKIQFGEEITFDYNSVTESKEEYEASVCLCGSQICRGSYLNLTGEGAFQKVLKEWHGTLDRYQLMVEACEIASVSEEDYYDLGRAGLGSCLLGGLPDWLVAYSARLVRFINSERTKLPREILKHNLEEKRKYFLDINLEIEKSDAEVQAEGVYNQRLQNLAITLDKVRYVMRCIFGDPKKAPPPLERLSPEEVVSVLWSGEGSLVDEFLDSIAPHLDGHMLNELKSKIQMHDPSGCDDLQSALKRSLLWLRDEVRDLQCTQKCRHDAAADLIHIYAHTKSFFRIREYKTVTSPPVFISPLDLGPKYSDKLGEAGHEYCKTYGENYCLGQLILWHLQTNSEPDSTLFRMGRGCLSLPDVGSFYAKPQKPARQRVYGPRTVNFMLARMEKLPQKPWPKDRIWSFKSSPKFFGSPMLDSVLKNCPLDREMAQWLKNRTSVFHAAWDQ